MNTQLILRTDPVCTNVASLKNGRLATSRTTYSEGDESEFRCARGFVVEGLQTVTAICLKSNNSEQFAVWKIKDFPHLDGCYEGKSTPYNNS